MRITTGIVTFLLTGAGLWLGAQVPDASKEAAKEAPRAVGLPPRAAPTDYQFRTQSGMLTLCAEFMGHGVPTEEGGPYNTENHVIMEAALYGAPGAKIQLAYRDFSLRINGKKAEPALPYITVFPSLTDPEWGPSKSELGSQAETSINGAGGTQSDRVKQAPKMPMTLRHTMEQRVLKASISEGERALPQAGLLFFEYHGELKAIRSMELIYNGPAGKATLAVRQP